MKSPVRLALCLAIMAMPCQAVAQESQPVLSLHEAIKTALEKSPSFGAAIDRTEAMKAATSKAGVLPNPELSLEAENIAGSGAYEGFDSAEITYGISQLVEMPGKRSGRQSVAEGEARRSLYERDGVRLDLIRDVVTAYAEAVAAQEQLKILQEEQVLAADVYKSVAAKVDAGKEPPIQKNKASIALSASDIALERAERSAETSKKVLTNLMGAQIGDFSIASDTLPPMTPPLGLSVYTEMIKNAPENLAYDAAIEAAQSSLSLEKANTVPDPTINIGVRNFRDDDEQALVAGLSFPLPVFDMNRAGVRKAGHEYNAAMLDKVNARLTSETDLVKSYERFFTAYREHQVLKETVMPGAQEAFGVARAGYMAGKFGYLEVLDAQRTLFETRKKSIETMLDYYRELAVIDRLTAAHTLIQKEEMK